MPVPALGAALGEPGEVVVGPFVDPSSIGGGSERHQPHDIRTCSRDRGELVEVAEESGAHIVVRHGGHVDTILFLLLWFI